MTNPNPFTAPRRSQIALEIQRSKVKARTPNARQQIVIYPRADAIKRQRMAKADI